MHLARRSAGDHEPLRLPGDLVARLDVLLDALARLEDPSLWPVFRDAVVRSAGDAAPDVPIEALAAAVTPRIIAAAAISRGPTVASAKAPEVPKKN